MRNIREKFYQIKHEVGHLKHLLDGIDMSQINSLMEDIDTLKAEKKYLKAEIKELKESKSIITAMNNSKMVYPAGENDRFNKCEDIVLLNQSQTVVKIKKNGLVKTFILVKFDFDYDSMGT